MKLINSSIVETDIIYAILNVSGDIFLTNRWWLGVGKGHAIKFREQSGCFVLQEPRSDRRGVLCLCKGTPPRSNRNNAATTHTLSDNSLSVIVRANGRNHWVLYCYLSLRERETIVMRSHGNKRTMSINYGRS